MKIQLFPNIPLKVQKARTNTLQKNPQTNGHFSEGLEILQRRLTTLGVI